MLLSTKLIAGGLAAAALFASAGAALATPGTATASVNVRSGPGTSYGVIDALYPGESVDVQNCRGGWCYVVHSGPDGWVSANYLSGADTGYYEPAPVYVEPAPVYVSPPIIIRPPYRHYPTHRYPTHHYPTHHYPHHQGDSGHHWTGKPPTGTSPHMTSPQTNHPVHTQRPVHVNPSHKMGPGNGGNICQINPDVCKPHNRGH